MYINKSENSCKSAYQTVLITVSQKNNKIYVIFGKVTILASSNWPNFGLKMALNLPFGWTHATIVQKICVKFNHQSKAVTPRFHQDRSLTFGQREKQEAKR